ncbi:MAG: exostosin family protein [Algicola sp.]|nr:exostosin family protein [Algicola sp.]
MKLYYPQDHYNAAHRGEVFPLLKPFLKAEGFTDAERIKLYGVSQQDYTFVNTIQEAEVVILPMSWNYYTKTHQLKKAKAFIENAAQLNKKVWIAMLGDSGLPIPNYKHTLVFRASGYASKLPKNHRGLPVFITDPLQRFYATTQVFESAYHKKPIVGFCGQASFRQLTRVKELLNIGLKNAAFYLNQRPFTPEAWGSSSFLRGTILKHVETSNLVNANIIVRSKYRAGAISKEDRQKTAQEFYNNIKNSEYTLCVRGAGNFSVRLYETLAMGRIPIYVNTDGLLPLQDTINWKNHVVWVEKDEIHKIAEIVWAFHQNLNTQKLNELFDKNRTLWRDKMSLGGFFKAHLKHIENQ